MATDALGALTAEGRDCESGLLPPASQVSATAARTASKTPATTAGFVSQRDVARERRALPLPRPRSIRHLILIEWSAYGRNELPNDMSAHPDRKAGARSPARGHRLTAGARSPAPGHRLTSGAHSPAPTHRLSAVAISARRGRAAPARSASVQDIRMIRSAPRALT